MHELFEELEAFDPKWRLKYATTLEAAKAAGVHSLWLDWCQSRNTTECRPGQVPDVLGAIQRLQAQSSSLPYTLNTIGEVPDDSDE